MDENLGKEREGFMSRGLFDPDHLKRVEEMRKAWKFYKPTQESVEKFFKELREGIEKDIKENPNGYWATAKRKADGQE